jgi:hypothetical protein
MRLYDKSDHRRLLWGFAIIIALALIAAALAAMFDWY